MLNTSNYTDAFMASVFDVKSGFVDELTFDVKSFDRLGNYIKHTMILQVSLTDYPTSTPASIPVIFNYRECSPLDFAFNFADSLPNGNTTIELKVGSTHADIDIKAI